MGRVLRPPELRDSLQLGVENCRTYRLAVEVGISQEGTSGSGEGEHRQWNRNGNVYTDLHEP
ncbi:unnamed protein product [Ixodes persulcatus]